MNTFMNIHKNVHKVDDNPLEVGIMDYESTMKKELWQEIKARGIEGLKWTSTKEIMVEALYADDGTPKDIEEEDISEEEVAEEEVVEPKKVVEVIEKAEEPKVLTLEDLKKDDEVVVFKPLPPKRPGSQLPGRMTPPKAPARKGKPGKSDTVAPSLGSRMGGTQAGRRHVPGFVGKNKGKKGKRIRWG